MILPTARACALHELGLRLAAGCVDVAGLHQLGGAALERVMISLHAVRRDPARMLLVYELGRRDAYAQAARKT